MVLGASVANILSLLYKEFALLLLIAALVVVPVAWFTTSDWLQNYAFRIKLHWSFFVLPFLIIVAIAWIPVSFQSVKAAISNPVKSLRTE